MNANRCVMHDFLNPILDCMPFTHKARRSCVWVLWYFPECTIAIIATTYDHMSMS
jgi:hypothetical protein